MSDILEALKDAVSPKRRAQATDETCDAHKRGPYPDQPPHAPVGDESSRGVSGASPVEARNPGRAEQTDLSGGTATSAAAPASHGASPSPVTCGTPSKEAPASHRGVNSDRDRRYSQGVSEYNEATHRPVHAEGGKFGLS